MPLSDDDEIKKFAREGAADAAFIVNFAQAAQKLRQAEKNGSGCALTAGEAQATVQALRYLREGHAEHES